MSGTVSTKSKRSRGEISSNKSVKDHARAKRQKTAKKKGPVDVFQAAPKPAAGKKMTKGRMAKQMDIILERGMPLVPVKTASSKAKLKKPVQQQKKQEQKKPEVAKKPIVPRHKPAPQQIKLPADFKPVVGNKQNAASVSANWKALAPLIQPSSAVAVQAKTAAHQSTAVHKSAAASAPGQRPARRSTAPLFVPLTKPIPQRLFHHAVAETPACPLPKPTGDSAEPTKVLAIDCEMVGVGHDGVRSMLASVCVVNSYGNTVYMSFVAPTEPIVDYRTKFSGITEDLLVGAPSFQEVRDTVAELIKDRILVGHGLVNDFRALKLRHPLKLVRDTAKFEPLLIGNRPRKLQWLAQKVLNLEIQTSSHDPEQDARVSMLIYKALKKDWEKRISEKKFPKKQPKKKPLQTDT